MKTSRWLATYPIWRQRWLALWLAVGLGLALCALLLAGLRPTAAAAAGLAEPAVSYPCSEAGLNSALAAGGSATFACISPTVIGVSTRKNVPHNLTLDGTNTLILTGTNSSGIFTVPAGVHLNLLNVILRDAGTGAINNLGVLNVTHGHFISNTEYAVWNMIGGTAVLSATSVQGGLSKIGQIINGDFVPTETTSLSVINSSLHDNFAGEGAALVNSGGSALVSGSTFQDNFAVVGGAILNEAKLSVSTSQFIHNGADPNIFAGQAARLPADPAFPNGGGGTPPSGGAIYNLASANLTVASSSFTDNYSTQGGGAIMFGPVPLGSPITPTGASLTITGSSFSDNCTGGPGAAVAASGKTTVSDSTFTFNFGDANPHPCVLWSTSQAGPSAPQLTSAPALTLPVNVTGAGGALFSSDDLQVNSSRFLTNTATITEFGGGGAIENFSGGSLRVNDSTFADNTAADDAGGAIFNGVASFATILNGDFHGNHAEGPGGAIANLGVLTVHYSQFTANNNSFASYGGGAIFSGHPGGPIGPSGHNGPAVALPNWLVQLPDGFVSNNLNVDHSTFVSNSSGFEGGALDAGPATILASTFANNRAAYGGAIDILAPGFTVSASTFTANAATTTTLLSPSQGGAIDTYNSGTPGISVINSTFFGNRADFGAFGGAINGDGGVFTLTNSTFLSNTAVSAGAGGGLSGNANFVVNNTLLAFNAGGNCLQTMTLDAHNLDYPGTSCGGTPLHVDPRALAPRNNGGPTLTSALLPGSPAINSGKNSGCPGTDQRGAHRPVGGTCDIGAFEFGGLVARLWLPLVRK